MTVAHQAMARIREAEATQREGNGFFGGFSTQLPACAARRLLCQGCSISELDSWGF